MRDLKMIKSRTKINLMIRVISNMTRGKRRDSAKRDNNTFVTTEEHKSLEKKKESLTNLDDTIESIDKLGTLCCDQVN